jgi:hypothetical protein
MTIDLKSVAIGFVAGMVLWGAWYSGSTRPVIDRLVTEKAQAIGRANTQEQEAAKYKAAAEHWFAVANSQPQAVPQDPTVAMLNTVRPGLGTLAVVANQAWQQHKAQQQAEQTRDAQDRACAPLTWTGSGCGCPPGYTATKTSCMDSTMVSNSCPSGQVWNGIQCACAAPLLPFRDAAGQLHCVEHQ